MTYNVAVTVTEIVQVDAPSESAALAAVQENFPATAPVTIQIVEEAKNG